MGLLSGLLLLLGATAVSSISTNSKQDKMLRKYNEDHAGQNVSSADEDANFLRDKVRSEVYNDWNSGDKKMYPEEYIPFKTII